MPKFSGNIGYATTVETEPGIWEEIIAERHAYGDLIRNTRKLATSGNLNDNVTVSNEISIVSEPYSIQNFHAMRYVVFMGSKWKIESVEVQYPRLILSLGGLYNA